MERKNRLSQLIIDIDPFTGILNHNRKAKSLWTNERYVPT